MRKVASLLVMLCLLAGCAARTADAVKTQRLTAVLNGCIAYEVDSAGGSLKTAIAAADLVVFLAGDFVPDDLAGETLAWQQALDADDRATIDANWPGVYRQAQEICDDPAEQKDLLDSAGVTTDFSAMDLSAVPEQLDAMNQVLGSFFEKKEPKKL